jgi:hypothetical protein
MSDDQQCAWVRYGAETLRRACPTCSVKPYQECLAGSRKKGMVVHDDGSRRRPTPHPARRVPS